MYTLAYTPVNNDVMVMNNMVYRPMYTYIYTHQLKYKDNSNNIILSFMSLKLNSKSRLSDVVAVVTVASVSTSHRL